ncbi:MAG TPA: ABC transporter substrate-binding protein [Vicinamibacterales bacterium]|jgi:putative ABC transport system substrate-binding protein
MVAIAGLFTVLIGTTPMSLAQVPPKLAFIAILEPGPEKRPTPGFTHMKKGLAELGWVEGRTARFETRYADWQPHRMVELAQELVLLKPDVLYTHSTPAVQAAMQATTSIPIVVGLAADLLGMGAVKSLAKPGGNVTGMTGAMHELDHKRLEVLKEAVPSASRIADLVVPGAWPEPALRRLEDSAQLLGVRLQRIAVRELKLEAAFSEMMKERVQAVFVRDAASLAANVDQVAALALKYRLPTISQIPRFAESGGLLQYGADNFDMLRRSATHVDRILKGAKPADLPVEQPTTVELAVNLKTARLLGIALPPAIMTRAARVIE